MSKSNDSVLIVPSPRHITIATIASVSDAIVRQSVKIKL